MAAILSSEICLLMSSFAGSIWAKQLSIRGTEPNTSGRLTMAMLLELISKLDANIQIRGRQFEHICKWYLENDPKYRLELKKVWLAHLHFSS